MAYHWADNIVTRILKYRGEKKRYVCAAGITPSGMVHFGNFREVITTDIVIKALEDAGKKSRFLYFWDDFDRFRKIPSGIKKEWNQFIGMPLCSVPDPFECHASYAEHFEREFEAALKDLNVKPIFIRQCERYQKCAYADGIKDALNARQIIVEILNKYRTEPLPKRWFPLRVYCEKCGKDTTNIIAYDGDYEIEYNCDCGYDNTIDFSKVGIVKLPWRVDWPMRWAYEDVDFEPGGKDHSMPGSSRTTGEEIIVSVWAKKPPVYQMYDFIILKGQGGKMSGSSGDIISLREVKSVYVPEVIRWLFAGTRPDTEFAISFDVDVFKVYEDFNECERINFGLEKTKTVKERLKQKRIYRFSAVNVPKEMPFQTTFRHLVDLLQLYNEDIDKVISYYKKHYSVTKQSDLKKLRARAICALNWIKKYAPQEILFRLQYKIPEHIKLADKERAAFKEIAKLLKEKEWDEKSLHDTFYKVCKKYKIPVKDFFKAAYKILIAKERGPRLAAFILSVGQKKIAKLLEQL